MSQRKLTITYLKTLSSKGSVIVRETDIAFGLIISLDTKLSPKYTLRSRRIKSGWKLWLVKEVAK